MEPTQRREAILSYLQTQAVPVSATALAQMFGVSRQVVVGDIALLRASGQEISPTPRGYLLAKGTAGVKRQIACIHDATTTQQELTALVDCGCTVVDVTVEHPVYGQLTGLLGLQSRFDVAEFMARSAGVPPLSTLTHGIHLHTITAPDEATLARGMAALAQGGFLVHET